ncbi:FtsW/RodA/SpoVE family cell cycle protein [uncultured Brachyspira sp.]|uniref:FtsW/RodA/SpoVE family cell cycle protein n=1 Tax=uncultured Brachyspira sp. TaxID=221953 RepID=UPI0025F18E39|nr:FtsW/RodA/SpoVE family cell cycle protein [uncultured Brachyspira sp.]
MLNRKLLPDKYLSIIYAALLIAGLVSIYGAQTIHEPNTSYFYNHLKLLLFMLSLTIIMLIIPDFFSLLDKMVPIILLFTLILLIWVYFFGITVAGSYAKRWLLLPLGITIQPSEVAKITCSIYFASVLSKKGEKLIDIKRGLFPPLLILILVSSLILIEPDSGTALLFSIVGFSIFFYGGIPLRSIFLSGILILLLFFIFIFSTPYMKSRIMSYLYPENQPEKEVYQIRRAKLAFNYGGISGIPDENIRDVSTHLPAALTDFIYASVAQRYGLIGNLIILLLFLSFTIRGFIISSRTNDLFLKNLSFAITMFISVQAYLNIMVATLMLPTTGMTLPIISYGRNALVVNMIMIGMLLKITQRRE